MRFVLTAGVAAILAFGALAPRASLAQPGEEFDGPPPRGRGYQQYDRIEPPPLRANRPGAAFRMGLNCDAVMPGITGPHPFSCPLPAPRPLGARCYCETPPASFTDQRTLAGEVVP